MKRQAWCVRGIFYREKELDDDFQCYEVFVKSSREVRRELIGHNQQISCI